MSKLSEVDGPAVPGERQRIVAAACQVVREVKRGAGADRRNHRAGTAEGHRIGAGG